MKWHQLAINPQSLDSLYETVPELENVRLFSINLVREGSQIEIRFDLPAFPDKPSVRWHKDFNTAQVQLTFWGIRKFEGKGWQTDMKVKIDMNKNNELLEVIIAKICLDIYGNVGFNPEVITNFSVGKE